MTDAAATQIFHDSARTTGPPKLGWYASRVAIYGVLIFWAVICLFPIYWTVTTSFKMAPDVMKGHMIPWVDFTPKWIGLEIAGPVARHDRQRNRPCGTSS